MIWKFYEYLQGDLFSLLSPFLHLEVCALVLLFGGKTVGNLLGGDQNGEKGENLYSLMKLEHTMTTR